MYHSYNLQSFFFPNGLPHIMILLNVLMLPYDFTCHSTPTPPPGLAAHQSAVPAGPVLEFFPVAGSRSHTVPVAQASQTWQHWRVGGRVQSCSNEEDMTDIRSDLS